MVITESLIRRFWKYAHKADGCWLWTGTLRPDGYGVLGLGGRKDGLIRAHRLSWIIRGLDLPDNMIVCHKCDTPPCVNPEHLFIGTHLDNHTDMKLKGRSSAPPVHFGTSNNKAHLIEYNGEIMCLSDWSHRTGVKATTIRARLKSGWSVERSLLK